MARPGGLEPPTFGFVGRYSIQLSYGRAPKESVSRTRGLSSRSLDDKSDRLEDQRRARDAASSPGGERDRTLALPDVYPVGRSAILPRRFLISSSVACIRARADLSDVTTMIFCATSFGSAKRIALSVSSNATSSIPS